MTILLKMQILLPQCSMINSKMQIISIRVNESMVDKMFSVEHERLNSMENVQEDMRQIFIMMDSQNLQLIHIITLPYVNIESLVGLVNLPL